MVAMYRISMWPQHIIDQPLYLCQHWDGKTWQAVCVTRSYEEAARLAKRDCDFRGDQTMCILDADQSDNSQLGDRTGMVN